MPYIISNNYALPEIIVFWSTFFTGRGWKASELRLKSWDDLQKLWYVLLKEKNLLMTQRQMLHAQNLRFPNPERIPKVRVNFTLSSFQNSNLY